MQIRAILLLTFSLYASSHASADERVHWGYDGATGPAHWAGLDEAWATCDTGKAQSPIDLSEAQPVSRAALVRARGQQQIDVIARATTLDLIDNGHTIQITSDVEINLQLDERSYRLVQLLTTQLPNNARPTQPLGDRQVLLVAP
jgi:carbonic anhydrase